jgi:outer membrane protein assembly factor BamA
MRKRDTRKLRQKMKTIHSYKKLRKIVEDAVKDSVSSMRTVSRLDNIRIELIKTDSWGDTIIYTVKGYIEVQVKTGFFSTKPGKKDFTATVKVKTGEIVAINWEPGEIS